MRCPFLLAIFLYCLPHLIVSPVFASHCAALPPPEAETAQCPPATRHAYLSAVFGVDTLRDTHHCPARCDAALSASFARSMRWEMAHWMRANRSVGMHPSAYAAVLRAVSARAADDARVNATRAAMPWLFVPPRTLEAARAAHAALQRRTVVRVLRLTRHAAAEALLRRVARWWREAARDLARDTRVAPPLLPALALEAVVGAGGDGAERPRPPLPSAVVLRYAAGCPACDAVGAAFDLLPRLYRRMCGFGHAWIRRCSPVLLFVRAEADAGGMYTSALLPAVTIHGARRPPNPLESRFSKLLLDSYGLFSQSDPFVGYYVNIGPSMDVVSVLEDVLFSMVFNGLIDPRYATATEQERERERQLQESLANNETPTDDKEMGNGHATNHTIETSSRRREKKIVPLKKVLSDVVRFHVSEIWGNDSLDVRDDVSFTLAEPTWFKVLCVLLAALWLALWPLQVLLTH